MITVQAVNAILSIGMDVKPISIRSNRDIKLNTNRLCNCGSSISWVKCNGINGDITYCG